MSQDRIGALSSVWVYSRPAVARVRGAVRVLEVRFAIFSIVVLVIGAIGIGWWVSRAIEGGVLDQSAATTAAFAESFVGPEIAASDLARPLDEGTILRLDRLFENEHFAARIVSVKLWSPQGVVRYARTPELINEAFDVSSSLEQAIGGQVISTLSAIDSAGHHEFEAVFGNQLLETYVPVRSADDGRVVAVMEFYELPDAFLSELRAAQQRGWIVVAAVGVFVFAALNGMVGAAGRTIRSQQRGMQSLADRLLQVSTEKVATDEALFHRIAQDLHDGPGQELALAMLQLSPPQTQDGRGAQDAIDRASSAVERALDGIRDISAQLQPPDLDGQSLRGVAELAATEHEERTGEAVEVFGNATRVPHPPASVTIYRAIREALANSTRHSGPGERHIMVADQGRYLLVRVTDDGRGFDREATPEGLGLRGMRERAEVMGGALRVRSSPHAGTTVELTLPWGTP